MTTGISFLPGVGIPGRVWESGRPTWIEDVQEDPNFPRLRAAAKNDLHAAIGLPLWSGTKLVGVIEFFSRETRLADRALLEMLVAVANHIGEFLYRLRTEEELREAEERFRGAFDDAPTGMMLFSVGEEGAGRLLEVNRELCSITGFTMDQLEGRSYHDLSHPQEVEADLRRMRQLLAGRVVSYRHEQRYVHADGHVVWVAVSASLVGGASGEAAGGIAQVEDITERRGAEEQLARLGAIVESADDAIIGMTLLGTVAAWNAGAERLYGYSAEEAIGQDMSMLVPDGQEDDMPNLLDRIARGETIDRFDTVCRRKDGTEVDVSLTMSPTPDRDGKIAGAAVIAGDISERKRAEEELAIAAGELERSNAELEQFGVIVAHDLSEPMRVVAGFAELVRARYAPLLDADGSRFLDAIGNGAARMQRLIDDLLAYARVGRQTAWGTVDCQSVLDEALAGLARQLEETGATVEVDTLPRVQGDVTQIGQLFQNLIGNALKFAGEARPEVHVSAEKEKDGWRFRVSDNGIGMERKNAERIFHPFQRLNPSDDIPGTGIGLSICRRIVGFHRGRIWVEGSPGEGSVFNFTIADEARGRSPSLAAPR
jgi:PAS domain S-box-containing protein